MPKFTAALVIILFIATVGLTVYLFTIAQKCPSAAPPEFDETTGQIIINEDYVAENEVERILMQMVCGDAPVFETSN